MNLLALNARMRQFLDDYEGVDRFSNDRINAALNESQVEACRRSDLIIDSTTESVCRIQLLPHVAYYPIDPSIKKIKAAHHEGCQFGRRELKQLILNQHEHHRWLTSRYGGHRGRPESYVLDKETGALYLDSHIDCAPDDSDTLHLTVIRLPITRMVKDSDVPEILEQFHLSLCYWAVFLLLSDNDPDTVDPAKADKFASLFAVQFGDPVNANAQMNRLYNKKLRATARFL